MAARENPPLWLQNYRTASYRGAEFYVDNVDSQFGRRIVTHEYPQRDIPYSEDLGRKARQFNVTGYLIGGEYQLARDGLIEAVEIGGPGDLVHPYMGTLSVVCGGITVRERRQDGGYCEVSFTFIEDGKNEFPAAISNPQTAVDLAADSAQGSSGSVFDAAYDIDGLPEFVRTEMVDAANNLLNPFDRLLSAPNDFADSVLALRRDLITIINRPAALVDGFLGVINRVTKQVGKTDLTSATLHDLSTGELRLVPETTGTRLRQSRSQNALENMVREMGAAEHARVVAGKPYDSYQQALNTRSQLMDEIDQVSETAADEVFDALQTLRAKVVQSIPDPRLPEIQSITMRQSLPALALAYQIYGDPLRDTDIVTRNQIGHPGFIPGGSSVEVVIRG